MKIKQGFLVSRVGGENIVIATGELSKTFKSMITLNDSGKFIWDLLEKGADLDGIVKAMTQEYEVSEEVAKESAQDFIRTLEKAGALE